MSRYQAIIMAINTFLPNKKLKFFTVVTLLDLNVRVRQALPGRIIDPLLFSHSTLTPYGVFLSNLLTFKQNFSKLVTGKCFAKVFWICLHLTIQ